MTFQIASSNSSGGGGSSIEKVEVVLSGTYVTTPSLNFLVNVLQDGANNRTALLSGATVRKVLEVKYKNPKYVGASGATDYPANEVYNRLKIGFFVAGIPGQLSATGYPICYITPGEPIKKADDIERQLIILMNSLKDCFPKTKTERLLSLYYIYVRIKIV